MKIIKRLLSVFLCFLLLLCMMGSLCTPASAGSFPFTDVPTYYQYYDAIEYVYNEGIMNGTSDTTFSPTLVFDRGMFVTTLYRMSGSSEKIKPVGFTDVPSEHYYYYAVGWAQAYEIIEGVSPTSFAPSQYITREQAITILYRYATAYLGESYDIPNSSIIPSGLTVSSWAKTAVTWAMNCGIPDALPSAFEPTSTMNRGMAADYLYRFETLALGDGKATAITSLSPSTTEEICDIMNDMGYDANYQYDLRAAELEFAFRNSSIIYTHSHGGPDGIQLHDDTFLRCGDIDYGSMSHVDLAYISACEAGQQFAKTLVEAGKASSAVGFTKPVSAGSDTDGIHTFNQKFFEYYEQGYNLERCRTKALLYMVGEYGSGNYYGGESCHIYE